VRGIDGTDQVGVLRGLEPMFETNARRLAVCEPHHDQEQFRPVASDGAATIRDMVWTIVATVSERQAS
jgi:hypothetical protein